MARGFGEGECGRLGYRGLSGWEVTSTLCGDFDGKDRRSHVEVFFASCRYPSLSLVSCCSNDRMVE